MNFPKPIPVTAIAEKINATIIGDAQQLALGINEIHKVRVGDITFVDVEKYYDKALQSKATIIIINKQTEVPAGKTLLVCDAPFDAYNQLVIDQRPFQPLVAPISHETDIHPTVIFEPNVVVGHDVQIGANSYIAANTVIAPHTIIGENVIIQQNCTIGSTAFYFKKKEEKYHAWRSGGSVIIENDVQIGAGCTITQGVSGDTIIGEGTKLDCQIHIGHGVIIGKNCLLAAQVGIGGKTIVEDNVIMYGQVGVAQNLRIGKGAVILAKSGVSKDLEPNNTYFGYPASNAREQYKMLAILRSFLKK